MAGPSQHGGLGLGTPLTSVTWALAIAALVGGLALVRRSTRARPATR
jgi:hypothetical protein